jgi:hypothetical protein
MKMDLANGVAPDPTDDGGIGSQVKLMRMPVRFLNFLRIRRSKFQSVNYIGVKSVYI